MILVVVPIVQDRSSRCRPEVRGQRSQCFNGDEEHDEETAAPPDPKPSSHQRWDVGESDHLLTRRWRLEVLSHTQQARRHRGGKSGDGTVGLGREQSCILRPPPKTASEGASEGWSLSSSASSAGPFPSI